MMYIFYNKKKVNRIKQFILKLLGFKETIYFE